MAFLHNALLFAGVGAANAVLLMLLGSIVEGRKAFSEWRAFVGLFVALGVLAATPTIFTGQRYAIGQDACPRATVGGPSC